MNIYLFLKKKQRKVERRNLFISNYSRIEREVIELSRSIDFCDEQLNVYSTIICDLIIRCGADIESLYKELYRKRISKKLPETVGEVVNELDKKLKLKDKALIIDSLNFNVYNLSPIKPFSYEDKTENDFYHIFCCLKHDRQKAFQKATLRTLILSLCALYILNQYYLNEQKLIENSFFGEIIPITLSNETDIFSAYVFNEAWSIVDSRLNKLRNQKGITEDIISKAKKVLIEKTNIELTDYKKEECLFKVETTPEYKRITETFTEENYDNEAVKATYISQLFGNDKDIDKLLEKYGVNVLDAILYILSISMHRNRLRMVIND